MKFHIGQRVKRARHCLASVPIGATGTIKGFDTDLGVGVAVAWDSYVEKDAFVYYDSSTLEPIVPDSDAKFDAFMDNLRKLGKEPVPLTQKQLDEVRGA